MSWVKIFSSVHDALQHIAEKEIRPLKYQEKTYCLIRYRDTFYVSDSKCPHRGASLLEGKLNNFAELICPLHEYRFNLNSQGECHTNCKALNVYECKQDESGVYFNPE